MTLHDDNGPPRKRPPTKAAKTYNLTAETAEMVGSKQRRLQGSTATELQAQPITYGGSLIDSPVAVAFKFTTGKPHVDGRPRYATLDEYLAKQVEIETPYAKAEWAWLLHTHREKGHDQLDIVKRINLRAEHVVWNLAHGFAFDAPLPEGHTVYILDRNRMNLRPENLEPLLLKDAKARARKDGPVKTRKTDLDTDTLKQVRDVQDQYARGEIKRKEIKHLDIIRGRLSDGTMVAIKFVSGNRAKVEATGFQYPHFIVLGLDMVEALGGPIGQRLSDFAWSLSDATFLVCKMISRPAAHVIYELGHPDKPPISSHEIITYIDGDPLNLRLENLRREDSPYRRKRGAANG